MMLRMLRVIAIVIAIAALLDPGITSTRRTEPVISVIAADPLHSDLAARVARELAGKFAVIPAPFAAASGSVIAGDRLPAGAAELAGPVFAVLPEPASTAVRVAAVSAPARSPLDASVPIDVEVHASSTSVRALDVTLESNGLVVDRFVREMRGEAERIEVALVFLPVEPGPAALRVVAAIAGDTAVADLVVDVRASRWDVLFFDPRPSWMSTFVRRAIERDPRFVVTSRVITSRDVGIAAGGPPGALDDREAVERFDAIVVGAPEGLRERDVAGLDAYLRRRGGAVLLLLDQRVAGPYERLAAAGAWAVASTPGGAPIEFASREGAMRAAEVAWPVRLPAGARPLANTVAAAGGTETRPVVWTSAVGPGRLYVSGALDAWRYRDAALSAFDRSWQDLIAQAAAGTPAPIDITIDRPVLAPGETTGVTVTLRAVALSADVTRASVSALLETPAGATVRLWPDGSIGRFTGRLRAPEMAGPHRIVVSSEGDEAHAFVVVAADAARARPVERDLVETWARTNGGAGVAESALERLPALLDAAIQPARRRVTWHPMRSAWWILPFVFAAGAEWWLRRRRGLA
jgi:hypothetical protein